MKKFACFLLGILLLFSLASCTDDTVQNGDASSANATFTVTTDKTTISGETEQVTITVTATAKRTMKVCLGTSSLGTSGAIWMECYMQADGKEYKLYDNYWDRPQTDDEYEFILKKGESVERTLKFSRLPERYELYPSYDLQTMPKGDYRLRVRFQADKSWTDTEIVIQAK